MKSHSRKGRFVRVAENLYRYSASKTYYAVYRRHGKLAWKSLKTTDAELAKRKLKDQVAKAGRIDARQARMTLEALLRLLEDGLDRFDVRTRANRKSILTAFKHTWKHGLDLPVQDVTPAQLNVWLAQHSARMKRTSLNAYILFLRQLFNLAISARAIAESPAAGLKILKREEPIRQTPTWPQFQRIVEDIRAQRFNADSKDSADLVEFMGLAGVGLAECANLKGEHVDFDTGKIWLFRSKTDTGYSIPVFPQLNDLLQRFRANGRLQNGEAVFRVRDPKKALSNACVRLKYPHFGTRALRRCFITRAIELGVDFKTIASWQGHRDGGVLIAKVYSHLRDEHSDAMAKKMVPP
ncbi:MAG: tyrosine-type recombinase/integrase [Limisphaerales bacterium]